MFLEGGKIHEIEVPLDLIPIFVKEGSIIPYLEEDIQHTGQIKDSKISLRIYPKEAEAKADVYLDDGETLNFKKGEFEIAHIEAEKRGKDTWYVNIEREGKKKQYIEIGDITIFGVEKSNYLLFEK
jgi:alpha-glucosidase (family GH31 glycosyl hydrolase)